MESYLVIIAVLIIFFCIRRRRRTAAVAWQVLNQRKQNKENVFMKELAKQFIGEECIIARTVKSHLETMSEELRKSTIFH